MPDGAVLGRIPTLAAITCASVVVMASASVITAEGRLLSASVDLMPSVTLMTAGKKTFAVSVE